MRSLIIECWAMGVKTLNQRTLLIKNVNENENLGQQMCHHFARIRRALE